IPLLSLMRSFSEHETFTVTGWSLLLKTHFEKKTSSGKGTVFDIQLPVVKSQFSHSLNIL
ncbi:hypothetical protein ACQP3J_32840, partial [Escherichia coli]